jgi:hypothetical protein
MADKDIRRPEGPPRGKTACDRPGYAPLVVVDSRPSRRASWCARGRVLRTGGRDDEPGVRA